MPKVYIKTYGCQMNERDSEQVSRMFIERGYSVTGDEYDADVILVNTCSVRDQAEQKALGKMGSVGRQRKTRPHVVYGFLGCMAQSRGQELIDKIPHLDLVAGTQKYHKVADYVDEILKKRLERQMDDPRFSVVDIGEEKDSQNTIRDHELREHQSTAFVSIMQGCNMKCTFCIVPYTRGGERGRPIDEIVGEVKHLASRGVKEVTLLGQIVNLYGRHEFPAVDGKSPFVQLLEAINAIDGIERIRFTSPHPIGYKDDLINAFSYLAKLAEHVHLPLQSGSNKILKAMHRPYKAEKFEELCAKIRAARPGIAITTDIIVGFPGETEEDFQDTMELCTRVKFEQAFVFRYSKRKDTPAAEMDESIQVPERVKEERNQALLKIVDAHIESQNESMVGQTVEVLCEGPSKRNPDTLSGRTRTNKVVIFEGDAARMSGQLFDVKINMSTGYTLYGDPVLN
jgi:tRNA-2-methylthio-N6-dimethylallyladenosine synthase